MLIDWSDWIYEAYWWLTGTAGKWVIVGAEGWPWP